MVNNLLPQQLTIALKIQNNRGQKIRELADIAKTLIDRVHYILHDVLGMKKLFVR